MKTIGVIGAMETEVTLLTGALSGGEKKEYAHTVFHLGEYGGNRLVVACSGIGKVNSACTTQIMIDRFGVDCIINTGIAGGLADEVRVGDVVISDTLTYHDFTLRFLTYRYPFSECFKADAALITAAKDACEAVGGIHYYVKNIVSGDQFVTDSAVKSRICAGTDAYCVEMEGASIAHTCAMSDVPVVVIRTISDDADDGAEGSFEQFAEQTAAVSAKIVLAMTRNIS
ncbi:MAG: 5'-methylthioadenosine/adenosylhomocysteine nucleosidase [Acetanaerobacterium sp.]